MEQPIYLDNAATTALDPQVLEAMIPYMQQHFGNPSSSYSFGRTTKLAIETARKKVGEILGVKSSTLFFTSGGTESNNTAIAAAVNELGCTHIITSSIEHHAVLHTVEHYCHSKQITFSFVELTESGEVNYDDLQSQLELQIRQKKKCLVSLMHANNEIGTLLDITRVGKLCRENGALFHSDCVQTVGHYPINFKESGVHFASASGHKFHGPKGTGLLYVSEDIKAYPLLFGGGQERKVRAGTENVYGIIGFAKALEMTSESYEKESQYIQGLKNQMKEELEKAIPGVSFNSPAHSLYTVLSACFPTQEPSDFLVTLFDMKGVCISGGSACTSGEEGSHVIRALRKPKGFTSLRFSFSKYNTTTDITKAVQTAAAILQVNEVPAS